MADWLIGLLAWLVAAVSVAPLIGLLLRRIVAKETTARQLAQ